MGRLLKLVEDTRKLMEYWRDPDDDRDYEPDYEARWNDTDPYSDELEPVLTDDFPRLYSPRPIGGWKFPSDFGPRVDLRVEYSPGNREEPPSNEVRGWRLRDVSTTVTGVFKMSSLLSQSQAASLKPGEITWKDSPKAYTRIGALFPSTDQHKSAAVTGRGSEIESEWHTEFHSATYDPKKKEITVVFQFWGDFCGEV